VQVIEVYLEVCALTRDLSELLNIVKSIVNEHVMNETDELAREAMKYSEHLKDLVYVVRDFTLRGGKRLRALLLLIGYWSREWGLDIEVVKPLITLIEFLQSYLLVHDDIMDQDEMRRGGDTVHVWFRKRCYEEKLIGDCTHYGISQAILVGDYLESLAVKLFSELNLPGTTLALLLKTYARGLRLVCYGQYLDVLLSYKRLSEVREEDILTVHKLKTASYTVELPLHLGAIASGKHSDELLRELSEYAIPAGIAFQLRDDILGLYGDPSITGKPVGSDVREKKKTLLIIYAYNNASQDDRIFLEKVFEGKRREEIDENDVRRVQEIVKSSGALQYVEKMIDREVEKAREALKSAELINNNAKYALEKLLEALSKREK